MVTRGLRSNKPIVLVGWAGDERRLSFDRACRRESSPSEGVYRCGSRWRGTWDSSRSQRRPSRIERRWLHSPPGTAPEPPANIPPPEFSPRDYLSLLALHRRRDRARLDGSVSVRRLLAGRAAGAGEVSGNDSRLAGGHPRHRQGGNGPPALGAECLEADRRSAEFRPRGLPLGFTVLPVPVLARTAHASIARGLRLRRVAGRLERSRTPTR